MLPEKEPRQRAADHIRDRRPIAGAPAAPWIDEALALVVFHQIRVPRAHLARRPHELGIVARLLGRGEHQRGKRFAGGVPFGIAGRDGEFLAGGDAHLWSGREQRMVILVETREQHDRVVLPPGRAVFVAAGAATVQIALDLRRPHIEARRAAEDDRRDGRAVGFSRAGHSIEWSA